MGMLPKNLFKKPNNPLETYDKYNKSASPDIPSEMCVSCPNCRAVLLNSDLSEAGHVCPQMRAPLPYQRPPADQPDCR